VIYVINARCARCGIPASDGNADFYIDAADPQRPTVEAICKNVTLCEERQRERP